MALGLVLGLMLLPAIWLGTLVGPVFYITVSLRNTPTRVQLKLEGIAIAVGCGSAGLASCGLSSVNSYFEGGNLILMSVALFCWLAGGQAMLGTLLELLFKRILGREKGKVISIVIFILLSVFPLFLGCGILIS